jgi:hypothetical protein
VASRSFYARCKNLGVFLFAVRRNLAEAAGRHAVAHDDPPLKRCLAASVSPPYNTHQQSHDENHKEQEEQNLRDACGARCNSTEAENSSYQRNNEENQSVIEHDPTSVAE